MVWLNVSVDRLCIGYYGYRYLDNWLCINPCQTESIRWVIWNRGFPTNSAKQHRELIKATKNWDAWANQRGEDTRVLQQKEPENWWFLRTGVGANAQASLINISVRPGGHFPHSPFHIFEKTTSRLHIILPLTMWSLFLSTHKNSHN